MTANSYPPTSQDGWKQLRLKLIAEINPDVLPEDTDPGALIQYVDIGGVTFEQGIKEVQELRFGDAPSRARRRVRHGDVIVSTVRTYLKAIAPIISPPDNLVVSTGFAVVRPRLSCDPGFLAWALRGRKFVEAVVAESVGVSYPAIAPSTLGVLSIAVPPVEKQLAIAAFLDRETARIDALIEKQGRFVDRLEEHRRALISDAVSHGLDPTLCLRETGANSFPVIPNSWKLLPLRRLVTLTTSGPRGWSDLIADDGSLFFQSQNIGRDMHPDFTVTNRVRIPYGPDAERARIAADDVVVCITGARTGAVAHLGALPDAAYANQHVCLVRPNRQLILGRYLAYCLFSAPGQYQLSAAVYGLKQGLGLEDIREILVPVPDLKTQAEIVDRVDSRLSDLAALRSRSLKLTEYLREHRAALITAAVTGQIDVRSTSVAIEKAA